MLTQSVLRGNRSSKVRHSAHANIFFNLCGFVFISTYDTFRKHFIGSKESKLLLSPADDALLKRTNLNLNPAQHELLLWHQRLGHINMGHVQSLLRKRRDPDIRMQPKQRVIVPINHRSANVDVPLCAVYQFAKQKRQTPPTHTTGQPEVAGGSIGNILMPGQRVSTDLYASTARGRLPDTFGRESPNQ